MKPSEMTTVELMERIGIGDASEMAAELGRRAARIRAFIHVAETPEYSDGADLLNAINGPSDPGEGKDG